MNPWLISIPLAYLLGSIPFGYLLVRFFRKEDIRSMGSGNIGATNVARSGAKGLGIATLLLDLAKGITAVMVASYFAHAAGIDRYDLCATAGVVAILGHVFPIWLGFHGGKGVATALGVFLAISPIATLCCLTLFILIFLTTKYVSLASILSVIPFPILVFLFAHGKASYIVMACSIFIPVLIIAKHHQNIRRLLAGTESRFGKPKDDV